MDTGKRYFFNTIQDVKIDSTGISILCDEGRNRMRSYRIEFSGYSYKMNNNSLKMTYPDIKNSGNSSYNIRREDGTQTQLSIETMMCIGLVYLGMTDLVKGLDNRFIDSEDVVDVLDGSGTERARLKFDIKFNLNFDNIEVVHWSENLRRGQHVGVHVQRELNRLREVQENSFQKIESWLN